MKFEHECYDTGHLYNLAHLVDRGLFKPPMFLQLIFGILGGIGADLDNLFFMKRTADRLFGKDYLWSVLAGGRHQMNFCTTAAMLGGNVRVGLEDSLYIGPGKLAKSNAEQVAKIRRIVEDLGYEIATPTEARAMLGLKGARPGEVLNELSLRGRRIGAANAADPASIRYWTGFRFAVARNDDQGLVLMNTIDLKNRTAIVTGGARGIGFAIAKRMLASGASGGAVGRRCGGARQGRRGLAGASDGRVYAGVVDVTDDAVDRARA